MHACRACGQTLRSGHEEPAEQLEALAVEGLRKYVGHVIVGVDLVNADDPVSDELADLKVPPLDVHGPTPMHGVVRNINCAGVVDAERGGLVLGKAQLLGDVARVNYFDRRD